MQEVVTSIGVDIFFSLILSYFCFFVPAFKPCQGRLIGGKEKRKNEKRKGVKNRINTMLHTQQQVANAQKI